MKRILVSLQTCNRSSSTIKKTAKILLLVAVVLLTSCSTNNVCEVIDSNSGNLTQSMQNFFASKTESYAESSNFMAKIVSLDKLAHEDSILGSYYIYEMIVVVAPRCDKELQIDDISFSLSDAAEEYYANFPWLSSYAIFGVSVYDSTVLEVISGSDDAQAYRFNLKFDNAGNDNMTTYGLSTEEFDEMIKELNITISYNKTLTNTINITYLDDINFYQTLNDVPASRGELIDFIEGDGTWQVASYYNEVIE